MGLYLEFGTKRVKPNIRKLFDMKEVIYDHEWFFSASNIELYFMYRDLSLCKNDALIMKKHDLRYDITIIPPRMLGCEFVKTAGHYHAKVPGTNISFPEVYEVLNGEAYYLLQNLKDEKIVDVLLIKAEQGDKVIIPPNYGHITINASNKVLKMANWVAQDFESIYLPMKENGGGAYFVLEKGIVKNPNYNEVPEIRLREPSNFKEIGLQKNINMYGLVRNIEKLEFLTKPHKYEWVFEEIL